MKRCVSLLLAACVTVPAWSSDQLAKDKQCFQCHKAKEDWAGPAFHKIALKFKGQKGAEQQLARTILRGSEASGGPHWGKAKMPDQAERPQITEAQATALAQWVLKQ